MFQHVANYLQQHWIFGKKKRKTAARPRAVLTEPPRRAGAQRWGVHLVHFIEDDHGGRGLADPAVD